MPIPLIIAIPQGDPDTIEIRPVPPSPDLQGPPLKTDHVYLKLDTQEFMGTDPEVLAQRYAAPAFSALQDKLKTRGY
jgi:hypothetical protein